MKADLIFFRELKKTEIKENVSLRSKSISTLKNVGLFFSLTQFDYKIITITGGAEDKESDKWETESCDEI